MSKPSHIIARDFRGTRLYLVSVHSNHGMHWHSERKQAIKLDMDTALKIAEKASREWGTKCAVIDAKGNVATREAVPTTNDVAAANCRAILAQLSTDGKVDHKAFIGEMQSRSLEHFGKPLQQSQLRLLGKIAAAYEREVQAGAGEIL